jgi:hypothetical protein
MSITGIIVTSVLIALAAVLVWLCLPDKRRKQRLADKLHREVDGLMSMRRPWRCVETRWPS